jgi:hypothetical protein
MQKRSPEDWPGLLQVTTEEYVWMVVTLFVVNAVRVRVVTRQFARLEQFISVSTTQS